MGRGHKQIEGQISFDFCLMQEIMYAKQIHWLEVNRH